MKVKRVRFDGKLDTSVLPKGVEVDENELVFSGYDDDVIQGICKRMNGVVRPLGASIPYKATDLDRAKVKEIVSNPEIDVSGFGIYRAVVSSTQRDTDMDRYSKEVLDEFAAQYNDGRPVVIQHFSQMAVGRTFDAEVKLVDGSDSEYELLCKFYVLPSAQGPTANVKELLDTKIYDRFSIAAAIKILDVVVDKDSGLKTYLWDHRGAVVVHLGIVDMGANPAAHSKSASREVISFGEIKDEKPMDVFKKNYSNIGPVDFKLNETEADTVFQTLDKQFKELKEASEKMASDLKFYKDKEEAQLKKLREEYLAKKTILDPDADAEKLKRRANLLDAETLTEDIDLMKKEIVAAKKETGLDIKNPNDRKDKGNDKDKPKQAITIMF